MFQDGPTRSRIEEQLREFFLINCPSTPDSFVVWNAHKAFARGILIQQGARNKRLRQQQLSDLITKIETLERQNKHNASPFLTAQLTQLRTDLRLLFLEDFEKASRRLKLKYYTSGNRAGKLLVNKLKGQRHKTQIPYVLHPITKTKQYHPQAIADAFSQNYSSLYNLRDDSSIPQPNASLIESFLQHINLPSISPEQLTDLNSPITAAEVSGIIKTLPNNKSPGPDGFTGEYFRIP